MKRSIFIVVLLIAIGFSTDLKAQKLIGIRAGWHYATLVGSPLEDNPNNTFYIGLYRNNKFGGIFAIHTGLEYFQNGAKLDDNNYRKLHYISVPLGLRVKLGPVYALGGPALNFKVAESSRVLGQSIDDDNKAAFFDLPVFLGAGVKIFMFTVEARYAWGLLDVNDGVTNQYLQLGVGLQL